jgi:benzoate/toluate 1,2-dioxygenase alpha subunit
MNAHTIVDRAAGVFVPTECFRFDSASGEFMLDRSVYTDPKIFELEMEKIFEGNWIFLGHESQVPKAGDYLVTSMGRREVIVVRGQDDVVRGLVNACAHRGARVCRTEKGNKRVFTCSYHGWVFDLQGELLEAQREDEFGPSFSRERLGLPSVARVESYRGFIFGSLNRDVAPLREHLGGVATVIDMLVDQSPNGTWEVLKGYNRCLYRGNWKLLIENGGGDGLHAVPTHGNLMQIIKRKAERNAATPSVRFDQQFFGAKDKGRDAGNAAGEVAAIGNGHTLILQRFPDPSARPSYVEFYDQLVEKYGVDRADVMCAYFRQTCIYPNVFLMDQLATLIRYVRPISVDLTEVSFWCLAPVGESEEMRTIRLRQFEEFFMASGMGATDDNAEFEEVQRGSLCWPIAGSNLSFGMSSVVSGPSEAMKKVGIAAEFHGIFGYEGASLTQYQRWAELLQANVAGQGGR